MREFNESAVKRIILEMYTMGLATSNSLVLMDEFEFQYAFYLEMRNANLEAVIETYNQYCTLEIVKNVN